MGKKYLDTKKNSLEQSILGVWKTAVEEGSGRMDGRTSEYREHRKKLESARSKRESTKKTESYERLWNAQEILSSTNLKDVKSPEQRQLIIDQLLDSQKHNAKINELQAEIENRKTS